MGGGGKREADWPLAHVLACLLVSWLVLALPWLSGRVAIPWDAKAHFLPQLQFLAASLASGEPPFWAPHVFSGHPQIADPQSLIFSPPFLLLAWFEARPGSWAFDVLVYVVVLTGQAGILLYGRARGWHWAAALLAAIAFGFGAAMAWRIQHVGQVLSLCWFAVALWLLEAALERRCWRRGLLAGVAVGLMAAGRDQVALLCLLLLALRTVGFWIGERDAALRVLLPAAASSIAIAAVPLVLSALFALESNRPQIDLEGAGRGSLHPALLLTALVPDLFGASGSMENYWGPPSFPWPDTGLYLAQNMGVLYLGAGPLILILIGVARGRLWQDKAWFPTLGSLLMLLYALGWYTPFFGLLHEFLPGVALFRRPADAAFPLGALAALMAGQSLHALLTDRDDGPGRLTVGMAALVLAAMLAGSLGFAVHFDRLDAAWAAIGSAFAALLLSAFLLLRATRQARQIRGLAAGLFVLALIFDLAWHNRPNGATGLPPTAYDMLNPETGNETIAWLKARQAERARDGERDRVELAGLGFAWPNAVLTHRIDSTLGYNPLRLGLYSRATGAGDHVGLPDQRRFSALLPSYRSGLAELLGLRYVVTPVWIEGLDLVATMREGLIYENPRALPRVLLATEARQVDFSAILEKGAWPDFDPRRTVLLEAPPPEAIRRPGAARLISYRNTVVEIEADAPDGGWVVLNDGWQAWWRAEIDGHEARLLRANLLFRAVEVPPGRHRVRFVFAPFEGALRQLRRDATSAPSSP